MQKTSDTSPSFQDQLDELEQIMEQEKVQLSPAVEEYLQTHTQELTQAIQEGKLPSRKDLEFCQNLKGWITAPEDFRTEFASIEAMKESDEYKEAVKRQLLVSQWLDLSQLAKNIHKDEKWIDENFQFQSGKIIHVGELDLQEEHGVNCLPEGLVVQGDFTLEGCDELKTFPQDLKITGMLNAADCTSLEVIPDGVKVGRTCYLMNCSKLRSLPQIHHFFGHLALWKCESLTKLPDPLRTDGALDLGYCSGLTALPESLNADTLDISHCTSLTSIPKGIQINKQVLISEDLHPQVIADLKALKNKGQIGEIESIKKAA